MMIMSSVAGELTVSAGIDNDFVKQSIKPENDEEVDTDNLIFNPYLRLIYDSRKFDVLVNGDHNHVRRTFQTEDASNNYTDYGYRINYDAIENVLRLSANGGRNFRSSDLRSVFVDDFLLNADNLVKSNKNALSADLSLLNRKYYNFNSSIRYAETKTERLGLDQTFQNFDNNIANAQLTLSSGTAIRPISYLINSQASRTKRQDRGDFTNEAVNLTLGSEVISTVSLQLLGSYESIDIDNSNQADTDSFSSSREFYSAGLGISWEPSRNRNIEIGINRSKNKSDVDDTEDEVDSFISANINWQFSPRTSFSGSTSRRFFGDSSSLRLSHNTRHWRTRLSYEESVQSNSALSQTQELGLFVCDSASTDLSDCSLPDVLDPTQLEPGQTILPIIQTNFEVNDNITLRKLWSLNSSIQRRRTNLLVLLSHNKSETLELERQIDTTTAQLTASLNLSRHAQIRLLGRYSNIDSVSNANINESIVRQLELTLSRDISRRFQIELGLRYLNRSGDSAVGIGNTFGIQGPLTDTRVTASINYQFTNR
jgi:uncharacterized protein (PEP-CTERM system associated)